MPLTFHEWLTTAYPAPAQAQRITYIDADGDGDMDALYQAVGDGTGWLYAEADGDGSYTIFSVADSPFQGLSFPNHNGANFFVMDVDGDGDMDLRAGINGTAGNYYRNDGNGDFTQISSAGFPVVAEFARQAVGDFDGDGDADILYQTGGNGSAFGYAQADGDGTYTSVAIGSSPFAGLTLPDHSGGNYYTADFDGDGDLDVWAAADGAPGAFLRNDAGVFTAQDAATLPAMASSNKAVVADFDNDGDADILFQTGGAGSAWGYAKSNGDGTFTQFTQANSPFAGVTFVDNTGTNYRAVDANGDGKIDVVGGVNSTSEEVYYQFRGGVVINEVQTGGSTAGDEFIELKNTTGAAIDISGWTVVQRGPTGTSDSAVFVFPEGTIIEAGGHILLASNAYDGEIVPDFVFNAGTVGLLNNVGGGVGLREGPVSGSFLVDGVVWGSAMAGHAYREGSGTVAAPGANQSISRGDDTDSTGDDWTVTPTPTPERSPGPSGTNGADHLDGDGLVDSINGFAGDDIINGGGADDILHGNQDNDSLRGEDGDDELWGDEGDDVLVGGAGADELRGGIGNDEMKGGAGNDVMYGGAGDDTYYVTESNDAVIELLGEGYDTVWSYLTGTYSLGGNVEELYLALNGDYGGIGNNLDNRIWARGGDNHLEGRDGADELHGGAGDDTLEGGQDNDLLYGDVGNDGLYGGDGQDSLRGGSGNDYLDGGDGVDDLQGGAGNDVYVVTEGDFVTEISGQGTDLVISSVTWTLGSGLENLDLTGGANIHGYGNELNNVINGNSGDNLIYGDHGNDTLNGLEGDDVLVGDQGADRLTGGIGADTFRFGDTALKLTGFGDVADRDVITDFDIGDGDRIDLSFMDADWSTGANEAFTFVRTFTGHAGEAVLTQSAAGSVLRLDVDGDGKSDFNLLFENTTVTTADGIWIL